MLANETNLIDPWRLALQYNQSPNIRQIYDGLGAIIDNHSLWDFYKFFDSNQAWGRWLDKLAYLYNLRRPVGLTGDVFVLDTDMLDDATVVMDGLSASLSDNLFRHLLQIKAQSNLEMPSVDTISNIFESVFAEGSWVDIEENYMSFVVHLYLSNPTEAKVLYTLLDINPNIIGDFPGVSYTVVPHLISLPQQ